MEIHRLPALQDNYIFLLHDPVQNVAAVVDPAQAGPVLEKVRSLRTPITAIFNTHHHADHVGGNRQILQQFPEAVVYASAVDWGRIPGQQVKLKAGDRVTFGDRFAQVFFVPGHTRGHIAYYFPPVPEAVSAPPIEQEAGHLEIDHSEIDHSEIGDSVGELFCGDTIFAGGCGRLFEGTPAQMMDSIGQLRALPSNTRIWCAHEYTLGNLKFALTVEPANKALQKRYEQVQQMRLHQEPTVPTTLAIEQETNPFLRWDQPSIIAAVGGDSPARTFGKLRGKKDLF